MEKAVGALRVLQTFWSHSESEHVDLESSAQASSPSLSTLQAGPASGTRAKPLSQQKVKLEGGGDEEESLSSESNWTQRASASREQDERSAGGYTNLTSQNINSTTHRTSESPGAPQKESPDLGSHRKSDAPYIDLGFAMATPEARAGRDETSSSPQSSIHSSNEDIPPSAAAPDSPFTHPYVGVPRWRGGSPRASARSDGRIYSDEDVRNQPDIIFADGTLTMPLDGPHLREIIHRIEQDRYLCFKMRWYVARHVRRQYHTDLRPSTQLYRRRVNRNLNFSRQPNKPEHLISLRDKPFNRLDFEATRLQENFRRNQPGWQMRTVTQILQSAYEQYRWKETVTDEEVDSTLVIQGGADLRLFANARRMASPNETALVIPPQGPPRVVEVEPPEKVSSSSSMRGEVDLGQHKAPDHIAKLVPQTPDIPLQNASASLMSHSSTKQTPAHSTSQVSGREIASSPQGEINTLRAEIRELRAEVEMGRLFREKFVEEQRASQEALMAEMRMMLEAAECGRKRKRSSDKKHNSRRKSKKLRKYVRKLKELDAQTDESLSSSSPGDDSPSGSE